MVLKKVLISTHASIKMALTPIYTNKAIHIFTICEYSYIQITNFSNYPDKKFRRSTFESHIHTTEKSF